MTNMKEYFDQYYGKFEPEIPDAKYIVKHGRYEYYINSHLVKSKQISDITLGWIVDKHIEKLRIFEQMEQTDDPKLLKNLALVVTEIEYELQQLWGFERNFNFHRFWQMPKCLCSMHSMDNAERLGTPYKIYNKSCPIHGETLNES